MRNAVIRKKRLKHERAAHDFIVKPQRIVIGAMPAAPVFEHNKLGVWKMGANMPIHNQ